MERTLADGTLGRVSGAAPGTAAAAQRQESRKLRILEVHATREPLPVLEIGSRLRQAREGLGLRLADVEAATRIRTRYLAALEDERFDELPDGYARSFLRSYAASLALDADQLVAEYDGRVAPPGPPAPVLPRVRRRHLWRPSRPAALLLAGALALLGLLVAGKLGSSGGTPPAPSLTGPPPARKAVSSARARPRPASPVARRPRVVLRASGGDCWVAVRLGSESGPLLYEHLLGPGQAVSFARAPLWMRVGAPGSLVLTVDGRRTPLPAAGPVNVLVARSGVRPA